MVLGAFALTVMFTACKKKEEEKPANTWKVGETSYTAQAVNVAASGIMTATSTESGNNSIMVVFNGSLPTSNGTFNISDGTGANDVSVVATETSTQGVYNVPSGSLNVTVTDGKVIIDMAPTNANYQGMTTKPDAMVSMHIAQP